MTRDLSPIASRLDDLLRRYADLDAGEVATYIPELAKADPDHFGISLVTVDGEVYEVGDSSVPFTIQSVSKPFVYAQALADLGPQETLSRIGVEPTGDPFNAIVLDEEANRPPNPMVNAGAIAATGLVAGEDAGQRWSRILGILESFAGRSLAVNEQVAASESETGHRNRAIAYLMRNFGMIREDVVEVLDLYFRQCSVEVTTVDLAVMGATLAAGGVNPLTGEQAIAAEFVPPVLSVMTSCGMYNASGTWLYEVGLPAKSGVGGGIVAVLPGQAGIGVFSPRVDTNGNSERGLRVCHDLSVDLGMHLFSDGARALDNVRSVYGRDTGRSRRVRSSEDEAVLRSRGREVLVAELQGRLVFGSVERLSRHVAEHADEATHLIIDLRRVLGGDAASAVILTELLQQEIRRGVHVQISGSLPPGPIEAALDGQGHAWELVPDLDRALEVAEDHLLERHRPATGPIRVRLEDIAVCAGFDRSDIAVLEACAPERRYAPGEPVSAPGDGSTSAFLVLKGTMVVAGGPGPDDARLRVLGPGSIVGEMSLISGETRSAWLRAGSEDLVCRELTPVGLDAFTARCPFAAAMFMKNIARLLGSWLRDANRAPGDALVTG